MPHNRYFYPEDLAENALVTLSGEEGHHLVRVSRARLAEQIELVNGQGQLAKATIVSLSKQGAELSVDHVIQEDARPPVILALGISRMNHLEWIIEKGTELDATAFWLFPGRLSEKDSLSDNQQERLRHLAIAAMKQCGRWDLPTIELKSPLLQWTPISGTLLFGDLADDAPFIGDLSISFKPPVIWFIGPEKGFDETERAFLLNSMKAKGVRLHRNILRAETAPLVALSITKLIK